MRLGSLIATALGCGLVACGPRVEVENPSAFEEDDPSATAESKEQLNSDAAPETLEPVAPKAAAAEIIRSDLDGVLKQGPGIYIQQIEIEAVVDDTTGLLRGWQVLRWPFASIDLRVGDVVLQVNGLVIMRPDDVSTLWETLAAADSVDLLIERDGEKATLRHPIIESPGAGS